MGWFIATSHAWWLRSTPTFSSAGGMAKAGPMPISLGSTPTWSVKVDLQWSSSFQLLLFLKQTVSIEYIYILYIYNYIYTVYIYIEWNLVFFQVLQTWVIPFTLVGPGFQSRVRLKSLNVTSHVVNWLRNHENSPRFWLQMFQSDQDHGYLDQDHDIWIRFWLLWIQRSSNIHDLWYVPVCRCPACHHLSSLVIPSNTGETAETRHDGQTQLLGHGTPDPKGAARCQFPSWKNGKKRKRTEFHRDFMRITLGFNRDFMR